LTVVHINGKLWKGIRKKGTMMDRKLMGDFGEAIAANYLKLKGYCILDRKFRCRQGEIDIIASLEDEIVFVEVKTRQDDAFGSPAEAVDRSKREKLKKAGTYYLHSKGMDYANARFDVMEIGLNHIYNAV
jgi:putative endonuclease